MATKKVTITEALAEIKTIGKRINKKQTALAPYLARVDAMKDPLAGDGGSVGFIRKERQAIKDLQERVVELRAAIAKANAETMVAVNGDTRSIADWLTWRREVAPRQQSFLFELRSTIESARNQALKNGVNLITAAAAVNVNDSKPNDIVVNISEVELADEIDHLQDVLGTLDGLLSLKNATTTI